jgi:polyisoprenoid-binding protein YceI
MSGYLVVDETGSAGVLLIDPASIDTGNRMRDRHLRSRAFFDVKRRPQLRYEPHSIAGQDPGMARIDGDLILADARTSLPLDVTLHALADGMVSCSCQTEVDRVALGIRGARGLVPRAVQLDLTITLRRIV